MQQDKQARRRELYALMGDLPQRSRPVEAHRVFDERREHYVLEKLVLELNGIEHVPAYFVRPLDAKPGQRLPTVLYNHAHGGDYKTGKDELLEHVKQAAKVASEQWITIMIRDNLSGLPIEPLPGAPTDIAAETGFEFWRLELRGKENEKGYARVRDSGSLAVSLGNLRDADVRLYIVTPPG